MKGEEIKEGENSTLQEFLDEILVRSLGSKEFVNLVNFRKKLLFFTQLGYLRIEWLNKMFAKCLGLNGYLQSVQDVGIMP